MMRTINKSVFCILQVLILSIICSAQQPNRLKSFISRSASSVQNYRGHPKTSDALLNVVTRSLVPEQLINWYFDEAGELERPSNNNTQCFQQILEFSIGLVGAEPWAIQMLDSSSKIPTGILMGNIKDIGFYDECVSIKVDRNNETIQGRHCLYSVAAEGNEMIAPTFSICLPSACNVPDLRNVLQNLIVAVNNIANVSIGVESVTCTAVGPEPLDLGTILTILLLSVYIGYLVCCTIYDFYLRFIGGKSTSTFVKFSIYTNALRVLDTEVRRENIPAIQGIRFFSMCWVILGHTYFKQTLGVVANGADVITWMKSWTSLYVLIAPFTVDTFFVIGGFLTSYLFMKEMAKGTKFNIFMYYLHRYLRLTPALAVLLLLTIFIFPKIGSGALWELNMKEQEITCKSNWWPMLLYVQNYVNTDNIMCLGHLWYLAVDMQLFWISPIILCPLAWKPKIGLSISGALLIASIIVPAVISVQHKYSGALFTTLDIDEVIDFMIKFYMVTYTRCGAWLLGILLGYFLSQERRRPSFSFIITGWILAVVSFAFIFFSYRVFQSDDYTYNFYWEVFYNGFSRHIWSFGVCWLLYASIRGYAGIISKFLSLPIFMPFARISYCVYLFHFIYQIMNVSAARVPIYFSDWYVFTSFFSDFILSTFGGFVFCLLFESPFMVLEKIFFKKGGRRRQEYGSREKLKEIENGEACTPHDNYSTQKGLNNGGFRVNQIEE